MQRRMEDPNGNGGIDEDILLMFEEEDSHEKLRLPPTLTLYTGQRLIPSPPHHPSNNHKPSVNLHLSLGGSYSNSSTNTTTHHHAAAVDNNNIVINASLMMKKSYLDQNNNLDQMPPAPQKEIILIDDDDDHDIDWAARSASENRALLRALHIIKSESCTTSTTTHHHKRKTWSSHPYNQGVVFQEEVEVEGGIGNSMMNPDDFLSINLDDDGNNINAFKDYISSSSSSSSSSSTTSPPENNIRLLFPTHHDNGKSAPPNPNYYHCYYYNTNNNNNNNNNNIAPQGGALLGSTKSPPSCTRKENPMHCHDHDHTYMAAAPPFAFASNQWSNVPIPGALLMKKNEYVRDSEIEMIRHMPTVATDGGIPGGRRIEGFLYRYSKYEDVIIVCFCHGSFFTPKQFVMHAAAAAAAGVTAIEFQNPMRLITIVSDD